MGVAYSTFRGCDAMMRKLKKIEAFSPNHFAKALAIETDIEVKECQRVCPVEFGDLKKGIHRVGPIREGRRIYTMITTSTDTDDYSLIVHEDLEAFHAVGGAKYIEGPLKASAPHMGARIGGRIDFNKAL